MVDGKKIRGIPKVLIIDDSQEVHDILTTKLVKANLVVASAFNMAEAQKEMEYIAPDVILLDLHLHEGEMGGVEVCSQFKMDARLSDIPIVFITSDTDVEQRIEAFRAGAIDYIEKPFNTEEVLIRTLTQIELSQRRKEDKEKGRIQEDLLHLLSHELINPISSGQQLFEMVEDDISQIKTFGPIIEESYQQALTLIDHTRKMLAVDERSKNLELEYFNAQDIADTIVDMTEEELKEKNLSFVLNIEEKVEILCDWGSFLDGALKNIIENAIHFSNEGGTIELKASFEEVNSLVHFHIIDQGIGIPKKMFSGIFEVSVATKRTGTKGELGNGFGLPLANNIVKSFGGRTDVHSNTVAEGASESGSDMTIILRGRKSQLNKAS